MELHPTLWRTCRVLSGTTRLRLLRLICRQPGLSVSDIAGAAGISVPRASQELRRLNSRGLLQPVRTGRMVSYLLAPDPQVPDAAPIVAVVLQMMRRTNGKEDNACQRVARAFAHFRRIAIVRELLHSPQSYAELVRRLRFSHTTLKHHLSTLRMCRMVKHEDGGYHRVNDPHPLCGCLVHLIGQGLPSDR